ncbi:Hos4p NDAI_0B03700 [Naumovozyma dairenensis CBS 421]|uniref:Uncharacterized protein n=1 Tax=Naumovozyma dairenensis (strain ATCC 10597 / BCRC 20456 / CBS 421 / NBRC 0211 / NRRL Y-12639) TaxID=1071378 RepID=G0W6J3_NAUDC|nr:hypothetical protein NDAI_0B03700 [Naumovozyma dairenensis CBS 421]CCD23404.1 hypothetical protein NDAI_0B03700 [Naumovozyma dairenensis CBS 421]
MSSPSKQAVKKRSLSNYLSNVNSRKEELERIAKEEKEKQQKLSELQKQQQQQQQQQQREQKVGSKEEALPSIDKDDILIIKKAVATPKKSQDDAREPPCSVTSPILKNIASHTDEKEEDIESKKSDNLKVTEIDPNNTQEVSGNISARGPDSESKGQSSILRSELQSILKEPELSNDLIKTEPSITTDDEHEQPHPHDNENNHVTEQEPKSEKINTKEQETLSDTETAENTPLKPKRGKLIRADKLRREHSKRRLQFGHDSDSDLSDIDEDENFTINSSVLHSDISPLKKTNNNNNNNDQTKNTNDHETSLASSPQAAAKHEPIKKIKSSKPSHVAVTKPATSKQRRGIYRDSGGRTKLAIACDKGKFETAKRLIEEEGYDVNDQDNAGNSALHEAALNGHLDIVKLLVEHDANVNIQSYEMFQDTPLFDASANGYLDVVEYLLEHGANPTLTNAKGRTACESIEEDADLDEEDRQIVKDIKHRLIVAARDWKLKNGHTTLDQNGKSDPSMSYYNNNNNINGKNNNNSMRSSSPGNTIEGETNRAQTIIEEEFLYSDVGSKEGKDKLFRAARDGNSTYVGKYLQHRGQPDFKSLMEAVKFGHEDIVSLFLAFGAQINKRGKDGMTLLMLAVGRGHLETVKLLIKNNADVTAMDSNGNTALYYAENSIIGVINPEEIALLKNDLDKSANNLIKKEVGSPKHDIGNVKAATNESLIEEIEKKREDKAMDNALNTTTEISVNDKDFTRKDTVAKSMESDSSEQEEDDEDILYINTNKRKRIPSSSTVSNSAMVNSTNIDEADKDMSAIFDNDDNNNDNDNEAAMHLKKKQKVNDVIAPKVREETPEEKEIRLKATEEYIQKRLENKKRKEQEYIDRMNLEEERRIEEKEKQRIAEEKRLAEEEKRKKLEEMRLRMEQDLQNRRSIRALYPIGLRLIDLNDKKNYMSFMPLYYIVKNQIRYVLDLQLYVLTKDESILKYEPSEKVEPEHKEQLWSLLKFIFLNGGRTDVGEDKEEDEDDKKVQYRVNFKRYDIDTRLRIETQEYDKFANLPMKWIPIDKIEIEDKDLEASIKSNMNQVALFDKKDYNNNRSNNKSSKQDICNSTKRPIMLPTKLQYRKGITDLLSKTININSSWATTKSKETQMI